MKLLLDMNLSPLWVEALEEQGYEAVHWSRVGAPDRLVLQRAAVLDHLLDLRVNVF